MPERLEMSQCAGIWTKIILQSGSPLPFQGNLVFKFGFKLLVSLGEINVLIESQTQQCEVWWQRQYADRNPQRGPETWLAGHLSWAVSTACLLCHSCQVGRGSVKRPSGLVIPVPNRSQWKRLTMTLLTQTEAEQRDNEPYRYHTFQMHKAGIKDFSLCDHFW